MGKIPRSVTDLMTFVKGDMTFKSPSGGASLHPAYLRLRQSLTESVADRAAFGKSELFLAVCLK